MFTAVSAISLLTGCYATRVVRAPDLLPDAPAPGLMVSTIVETVSKSNSSSVMGAVGAVATLVDNGQLDKFGATVEPGVTGWLATQGVSQREDKARLMVGKNTDWASVANDFTVLSGTWVDPDGLGVRVATDTPFAAGTLKTMGTQLAGADPKETFVYTTVTLVPNVEWLVVGMPRVRVSVIVHDRDGKELLRARAWGVGRRTAFIPDRSPASLEKGFTEAMAKLAVAEIEAAKP
jgi:hypothetical protein